VPIPAVSYPALVTGKVAVLDIAFAILSRKPTTLIASLVSTYFIDRLLFFLRLSPAAPAKNISPLREMRLQWLEVRFHARNEFVDQNLPIKILALSFLLLVGMTLIGEGFDVHVPKGCIYFAMAFSLGVAMLNMRVRTKKNTQAMALNKSAP
jgi:hypothetical protein